MCLRAHCIHATLSAGRPTTQQACTSTRARTRTGAQIHTTQIPLTHVYVHTHTHTHTQTTTHASQVTFPTLIQTLTVMSALGGQDPGILPEKVSSRIQKRSEQTEEMALKVAHSHGMESFREGTGEERIVRAKTVRERIAKGVRRLSTMIGRRSADDAKAKVAPSTARRDQMKNASESAKHVSGRFIMSSSKHLVLRREPSKFLSSTGKLHFSDRNLGDVLGDLSSPASYAAGEHDLVKVGAGNDPFDMTALAPTGAGEVDREEAAEEKNRFSPQVERKEAADEWDSY